MGSFAEDIRSNQHVDENTFEHLPCALLLIFFKKEIYTCPALIIQYQLDIVL